MKTKENKEPVEYLNNAHLLQMEREGYAALPSGLEGVGYEHTFKFSSLRQLRSILDDMDAKKDIRRRMSKFAFSRTTCIFKQVESFSVPLDDQKRIIDYQNGLFTENTVMHFDEHTDNLQEVILYAQKKEKEVAVFTDLHYDDEILRTAYSIIAENGSVKRVKLYSLRIVDNVSKYRTVQLLLGEKGLHLHLTHCQRRISFGTTENLSYEHLVAVFGVASFTEKYSETERKRSPNSKFIPMPFNRVTLCYQPGRMVGGYRQQKLVDLGNVASELQLLITAVHTGAIQAYLRSKPELHAMLTELRITV